MASLPVVPDFAAGLAAAVGQLSTALRLPTGWVASPSLRWTPSGATLLVRWGPALSRAPGGGENRKKRRSAAQQRRSALRAAAHKAQKSEQEQQQHSGHPRQQLRLGALPYVPNSDQPLPPPTMQQRNTVAEMEVGEEGRVSERNEQQEQTAAAHTAVVTLSQAPSPASSPDLAKHTAAGLGREVVQVGQL